MPLRTADPAAPRARPRSSSPTRRVGYTVALAVNATLLGLVNVAPRWEAVPFLTDETRLVLGLVNASILTAIVVNAVYLLADPTWFKALGDVTQNVVGLAAMVQVWRVFPFAFDDTTMDWPLIARWVLAVGVAGSVVGLLVALVSLVRAAVAPSR